MAVIAFIIKYKVGSSQEKALKVDNRILKKKIDTYKVEKEILINHAKDANEETITSKKQLEEAKNGYVKGAGGDNAAALLKRIRAKYRR